MRSAVLVRLRLLVAGLGTAIALAALPGGASADVGVIPRPANVSSRPGHFLLRTDTEVYATADAHSQRIATYFTELLRTSHAMALRVRKLPQVEGADSLVPAHAVLFRLDPQAPGTSPESYQLDVSADAVMVSAREPQGLFYGAVTLWQLCSAPAAHAEIELDATLIRDTPRFRWRGLMLDSARHFQSPQFVMRYIDWLALHKLNVLGWHLTDDQGWRLEIRKYPRLTSVGAWRVEAGEAARRDIDPATGRPRLYGGFYTQEDVRRIVAHARERYVTIVPEIDMPGHASAAIVAYPSLGVTEHPPRAVPADWGVFTNLYNVEESTFLFFENVLAEVMQLFPGEFIHVGGDEAVKDQWKASPRVQARMRELGVPNEEALQGYFTQRMGKYLQAHGRRLIGWDEILEGGVPPGATVMSWRGVEGAVAAAASGHDTVLSPAPTLYLDFRQGTGPNEPPGRGEVVSLERVYRFDPLPGPLAAAAAHVLGVQANLWTEHVRTEEQTAYMSWPRAAALSEIGWSAAERRDYADFVRRLPLELDRYRALGIAFSADVFAPPRVLGPWDRHMSQDLATCTDKDVLNLEDDAPLKGPRAVFLIDIENPCWMLPAAELTGARKLTAAVGQVPFNFQIGHDIEAIRLRPPRTPAGELEVRLDSCEGEPLAVLPLAAAAGKDAVTVLPAAELPALQGTHRLCFSFTQRGLDPMWAIDWVQLAP
ncbi:MAG TPA: beta-N-acetylhexosaminidase [Steroidobacteraceae bacterium]|nr:beta-N-acetylhexosaminidase [Steroidobacteraceae bacterium]